MSLFDKSLNIGANAAKKVFTKAEPKFRFGGWQALGAQKRPIDDRTPEQLFATIDELAKKNPTIKKFEKEIKEMNPKYLSLAVDTMELASKRDFTMTDINMNKVIPNVGKSLLEHLLSIYPKASKENPKAMEFAQEVINNTDTLTSKYFLADMAGIFQSPKIAEHLDAMKPFVNEIAESTINGGYLGTFDKQVKFTDMIKSLLTPDVKPHKISLIRKLSDTVDRYTKPDDKVEIYIDKFVKSDTPTKQVEQNIANLANVLPAARQSGKNFDVVDYVNNNVNFVRAKQNIDINSLKNGNVKLG